MQGELQSLPAKHICKRVQHNGPQWYHLYSHHTEQKLTLRNQAPKAKLPEIGTRGTEVEKRGVNSSSLEHTASYLYRLLIQGNLLLKHSKFSF